MTDFEMFSGDSKNITIEITDATDLMGSTAKWVVKKKALAVESEIIKTTDNGITISGNKITIKLSPSDTINLKGNLYHECELTDALGNVSTVKTGYISFKETGI